MNQRGSGGYVEAIDYRICPAAQSAEVETDATSNDQPREEPPAIGAVEMGVGSEFYGFIILQQTQASCSAWTASRDAGAPASRSNGHTTDVASPSTYTLANRGEESGLTDRSLERNNHFRSRKILVDVWGKQPDPGWWGVHVHPPHTFFLFSCACLKLRRGACVSASARRRHTR